MAKTPSQMDRQMGMRLRMRRLALGLTQEKLGQALGVSFQQIQKYEKGSNRIGASRLQQIARILEVSPSFFYDGMPRLQQAGLSEPDQRPYAGDVLDGPEGLHLMRAFARIRSPALRRKIIELVSVVALETARQAETEEGDKS